MGPSIDDKRALLQHFLGALAYRTQKALKGSPPDFGSFRAADGVRTPAEVVRHMTGVVSYARTRFVGGEYRPALLPSFDEEVRRFHEMLDVLSNHLAEGASDTSPERLLQGPLSDAMTHVGQLALLRRLAESPVPPESFIEADIDPGNLGLEQPEPVSPDEDWPEAPPGWVPPSRKT